MSRPKLEALSGGQPQAQLVDADTERELLAAMLLVPAFEAARVVELVTEGDFDLVRHRAIYRAMRQLVSAGVEVEPHALRNAMVDMGTWEIAGGARCLSELMDRQGACSNVAAYARRLRGLALDRREAAEWGGGIGDVLTQDPVARTKRLASIAQINTERQALETPRRTMLDKLLDWRASVAEPDMQPRISTGLPSLDRHLGGGLKRGWLVLILGAPKQGKTVLAVNNIGNAAMRQGFSLLYVGEGSESELIERLMARESNVPLRAQHKGDLSETQWRAADDALDRASAWRFEGQGMAGGVSAIAAHARRFKREQGSCDMLVVDYVQLVNNGNENRVADLEQTTRELKLLAAELDTVVVMVSQPVNTAARDKTRLGLYDGKGAGSIAADCDVCLIPVRDGKRAGVDAPGFRHGEAFEIPLGVLEFNGGRMCFEEPFALAGMRP